MVTVVGCCSACCSNAGPARLELSLRLIRRGIMPTVETTLGAIDVEELGLTLMHEHFRTTDEAARFQFPYLYDEAAEWEAAISDANAVKGHGVRTVVEPSAMFLTRDAAFSKRVGDESGLNVVLATGIYTYDHLPQILLNRDEDALAAIFLHELEHGIQGTEVKPALIKCAADQPGVYPNVEKVHRAAAPRSQASGKPIMAHSHPAARRGSSRCASSRGGRRPLEGAGGSHGRHRRSRLHEKLLDTGCWIGMAAMDSISPAHEKRQATTLALLARGYAERMFLSQDYCSTSTGSRPRCRSTPQANEVPDWSITFLFEKVIPELRSAE